MATIFDKLYVTIQYRGDANNESGLLGFASPYTKDSAFEKRKVTQDSWAYGSGITVTIQDDENVLVEGEGRRGGYGGGEKWDTAMLFMANAYPKIVKNEPVDGFEIAKSVRRYGWNGGGNVKWRITDPRGFDLEISSENFASIIDCSVIENGVIKGKCVWGREGKDNILLPENSEPYKKAYNRTKMIAEKLSLNDIKRGDVVTLVTKHGDAGYRDARYLGRMFAVEPNHESDGYCYTNEVEILGKVSGAKYAFQDIVSKEYFVLTKPVIGAMVSPAAEEASLIDGINELNAVIDTGYNAIDGLGYNAIMMVAKASDVKTASIELRPHNVEFTGTKFKEVACKNSWNNYAETFLAQDSQGKWYVNFNFSKNRHRHNPVPAVAELLEIEPVIDLKLVMKANLKTVASNGWYSSRSYTEYVPSTRLAVTEADMDKYTAYQLWIKAGDVEFRVRELPGNLRTLVEK